MLTALYSQVIIPGFEQVLKRRRSLAYYRTLQQSQWASYDQLQAIQFAALQRLVEHAFKRCPYYQQAWRRAGLHPQQLRHRDDWLQWPVIDRQTVRRERLAMRSQAGHRRLLTKSTGGSSGDPLQFDLDYDSNDRRTAAAYRGYAWAGAELGTRQLYLWGVPLQNQSPAACVKGWLYDRALYRRKILNSFGLNAHSVSRFIAAINRFRPHTIVAYTNPLYELARTIERDGGQVFKPASIIVGAEKLHQFQRQLIEQVFGAPVFETYGSREFMLIGAECSLHCGLHLTTEHLVVEILGEDGSPTPEGQEGQIVVTDLYNYGMPFVRYATGDRAVAGWQWCPCGRGLPLLRQVVGRSLDIIHTPDGRSIAGEFFPHLLKDYAAVESFQVVQSAPGELRLDLVTSERWRAEHELELSQRISKTLGPAVRLVIQTVTQIPRSRSGKLQVVRREF